MPSEYNPTKNELCLERVRFELESPDPQRFPAGKAGNTFRGALGWAMRENDPEAYARFFEPRQIPGEGPSGMASPPRPFVLRAFHLDGLTFQPGEPFHLDLHLFRQTPASAFISAMERIPFARLRSVVSEHITVELDNRRLGINRLAVRFVTPTELKAAGSIAPEPDFPILYSRIRDRIRALSNRELTLDFAGMANRAGEIALVSHQLTHEALRRTSRKTGQTHPLGGFRGEATYAGHLDEFVPLLEAARWTGIGRQTVWGKGVIELA